MWNYTGFVLGNMKSQLKLGGIIRGSFSKRETQHKQGGIIRGSFTLHKNEQLLKTSRIVVRLISIPNMLLTTTTRLIWDQNEVATTIFCIRGNVWNQISESRWALRWILHFSVQISDTKQYFKTFSFECYKRIILHALPGSCYGSAGDMVEHFEVLLTSKMMNNFGYMQLWGPKFLLNALFFTANTNKQTPNVNSRSENFLLVFRF